MQQSAMSACGAPLVLAIAGVAMAVVGCHPVGSAPGASNTPADPAAGMAPPAAPVPSDKMPAVPALSAAYSAFGGYAPLPGWSGWCGLSPDGAGCAAPLSRAVEEQSDASRPTVRGHGWHLWAAIWSPLTPAQASSKLGRNDALEQRTNLYGTQGCWSQFADGKPACSGVYPIWLTWPNTGAPYRPAPRTEVRAVPQASATPGSATAPTALPAAPTAEPAPKGATLRTRKHASHPLAKKDPNPTRTQTVNTANPTKIPTYNLPPLVLTKQCGIERANAVEWLKQKQYLKIVEACNAAGAPDVFCPPTGTGDPAICDGTAFVNQGDVMIATESLSVEGYDDIQNNTLYDPATLNQLYAEQSGTVAQKIGSKFVSTKHMFWPVKGCRPGAKLGEAGCRVRYGALPPWVPKDFKTVSYATNADYLGYERWKSVVAIDTCTGSDSTRTCPASNQATLKLAHVTGARPITTQKPQVYPADAFVHVQISAEVLAARFTPTDRALLDQATIWAYGDASNGFEAGDFLVVVAMHVNTKELPSWAFQSVWWSPMQDSLAECPLSSYDHCFGQAGAYAATAASGKSEPNRYSGLTAEQLLQIDGRVGTRWRSHYLMTDSYGINYELDGTPVNVKNYFRGKPPTWATHGPTGETLALLPVSASVYIEPVIHPLGTNCQNCHRRAGSPGASCDSGQYAGGCGRSNYQTAQCADLLGDYGYPESDACMTTPWAWHAAGANHCQATGGTLCNGNEAFPVLNTDWIWIIADGHLQPR